MATFILKIDPETREELYSDIALEFLDLIYIEGIFTIIQMTAPHEWPIVDDPLYYCDDPESQFETSVEYLLGILHENNRDDGIELPGTELREYSPDYQEVIATKLGTAVDSLRNNNEVHEIMAIKSVLELPEYTKRFKFSTIHLADRVVFNIHPDSNFAFPVLPAGTPLMEMGSLSVPL
jgi:hypothetical protein